MYIATRYIGRMYTPGEIIRGDLPESELKWLLEAGAIRKAAPAVPGAEAENEADETARADEIDEEAEAPEIDAMDGLVPEGTAKPASARKSAGKAKGGKTP